MWTLTPLTATSAPGLLPWSTYTLDFGRGSLGEKCCYSKSFKNHLYVLPCIVRTFHSSCPSMHHGTSSVSILRGQLMEFSSSHWAVLLLSQPPVGTKSQEKARELAEGKLWRWSGRERAWKGDGIEDHVLYTCVVLSLLALIIALDERTSTRNYGVAAYIVSKIVLMP